MKITSTSDRGLSPQLTATAFLMLMSMAAYECMKQLIFRNITIWESHIITIFFSAISATVGAYFILKRTREYEERYRTAIECSNDGVAIIRNGDYLYVNQRFLDMFEYGSREEVIDKPLTLIIHPDHRNYVEEMYNTRQEGEAVPSKYEFKGMTKNGGAICIEVSVARVVYASDSVTLACMRDVTDRKQMEKAKLYSAKLESALEMAGTVCHELNQPLQIISGYVHLLMMQNTKEDRTLEMLNVINGQAGRMGTITKQLMGLRQYSTRDYVDGIKIIAIDPQSGEDDNAHR